MIISLKNKKLSLTLYSKVTVLQKAGTEDVLIMHTFHIWSLDVLLCSTDLRKIFILTKLLVTRLELYPSIC